MVTIGNNNNKYIESQNIKVFPCAYRGYYKVNNEGQAKPETLVFDPEARATTEANFTNTFHKLSDNKESYVIAWIPTSNTTKGTLKCVIGGYYFEIYDHSMSDFFYTDTDDNTIKPYYLCIKTESISLGTSASDDVDARTTKVLSSFGGAANYLDVYSEDQNNYAFTGLLVSKAVVENATASLAPFIVISKDDKGTKSYDYKIDPAKLPITNLLDVGSGNYSLRMIEDNTASGSNTTIAIGDYSVALGLKTTATGEASTALGNNTEASAKGAFVAGNNTTASGEGAVALGSNTTASEANQVVIGQYNDFESDEAKNQAFIIANGTATAKSNKFTVSYEGNVKALGTLETKGNIKATGNSNNALELGTSTVGSSGSIKVYGETEDKTVFTVENTGNTAIAGTTNIAGNTEIAGTTAITNEAESTSTDTGALKVAGGVGVAKSLNVGGATTLQNTLSVTGNTTIAASTANDGTSATNTLVIGNKTTNISGALDIYGTATEKVFSVTNTGDTIITGTTNITNTTEATSTSTGALKVAGGVGVGGNLWINGTAKIASPADASGNTAALTVKGGEIVEKNLIIKGTTESTSATTGALVVTGGMGIGENLNVKENATIKGALTAQSLNLIDTSNLQNGNIKATTIEATTELKTKTLTLENDKGFDPARIAYDGVMTTIDKATTVESTFKSTKYTTLANTVNIDPSGNITGVTTLTASGQIKAQSFKATSDARKKTNIQDYQCKNSILDLPIKSFEYLNDDSHTTYIGCIAQDLQKICPELVDTDADGFLSIQETKLIYLLLDEVKKLKTRIEVLEEA